MEIIRTAITRSMNIYVHWRTISIKSCKNVIIVVVHISWRMEYFSLQGFQYSHVAAVDFQIAGVIRTIAGTITNPNGVPLYRNVLSWFNFNAYTVKSPFRIGVQIIALDMTERRIVVPFPKRGHRSAERDQKHQVGPAHRSCPPLDDLPSAKLTGPSMFPGLLPARHEHWRSRRR
jgi:hypothetical protein